MDMNKIKEAILSSMIEDMAGPEADVVLRKFNFPSGFVGFSGHFPSFPVLPAFVQVVAAQTVIESFLERPMRLHEIVNAKFLLPVRPGQVIEARCTRNKAQDDLRWGAVLSIDRQRVASFQLIFMDGEAQ